MSQHVVLSIGSDRTLLRVRDQVLSAAGYVVRERLPSQVNAATDEQFDIIILCHSIPQDERRRIVHHLRSQKHNVPILLVQAGWDDGELADASVHGLDGPAALLRCVAELLQRWAS